MKRETIVYRGMNVFIDAVSENALLLTWPEKICAETHQTIINVEQQIKNTMAHTVIESITSYNSLQVYYKFQNVNAREFKETVSALVQALFANDIENIGDIDSSHNHAHNDLSNTVIEIPVYYGELGNNDTCCDLRDVATQTGLSEQEVIDLHANTTYRAYALGFTPGFCYLGQLPKALHLPRKASPRLNVPKGAVAIAQQQTAVYPNNSPGGWHIIGRTPVAMYQVNAENDTLGFSPKIQVGQTVKFVPISLETFIELADNNGEQQPIGAIQRLDKQAQEKTAQLFEGGTKEHSQDVLRIEKLKGRCTFQDLGRLNSQHLGFSASGASDEFSYLFANKLLGNDLDAPVIEITLAQLKFKALTACQIALTGANCQATINDLAVNNWQTLSLEKGDELQLNNINTVSKPTNTGNSTGSNGLHTYLAIKNGINCYQWLGSASQNINELALGFTGKSIEQGQVIPTHQQPSSEEIQAKISTGSLQKNQSSRYSQMNCPLWQNLWQEPSKNTALLSATLSTEEHSAPLVLRFVPSPLFLSLTVKKQAQLLAQSLTISSQSNRMGYRLIPKKSISLPKKTGSGNLSKPVCFGTIQLPPNGDPIVLMKDRQTIGGYPVLGTVIQTDLFRLAQKRPGSSLKLSATTITFAQQQLLSFYQRFQ